MLTVDKRSRIPFYEQIENQIIMLIKMGVFEPNAQLPSIRAVALDTNLNVNTVKRAFSDLEAYGLIYSLPGRGSFVNKDGLNNSDIHHKALDEVKQVIEIARCKGVSQQDCADLIEQIYGKTT